jgi:hypothetical protein
VRQQRPARAPPRSSQRSDMDCAQVVEQTSENRVVAAVSECCAAYAQINYDAFLVKPALRSLRRLRIVCPLTHQCTINRVHVAVVVAGLCQNIDNTATAGPYVLLYKLCDIQFLHAVSELGHDNTTNYTTVLPHARPVSISSS